MIRLNQLLCFFFIIFFSYLNLKSQDNKNIHDSWGALLKKHVKENKVDYSSFNSDLNLLKDYLNKISKIQIDQIKDNEYKALAINAYNAYTVLLILENDFKNLKSIKDIPNAWDKKFCNLANKTYSLNEIENEVLRKKWSDPRIHFAINCASKSCPPLQPFAFTANALEKQLELASKDFINSEACIKIENYELKINPIFQWFKSDFEQNENSISKFLLKYLEKPSADLIEKFKTNKYSFFEYDWSINNK